MSYPTGITAVHIGGYPNLDSFSRLRVTNPLTLFDSKQTNDNQPLLWDDAETAGSGTSSTHSAYRASSTLAVGDETEGTRVRQTFRRWNYQPGKSQLIFMTLVLQKTSGATGITRRAGYFDELNGVFLEDAEGAIRMVRRSNATATPVDTPIEQEDWNVDPMDGTGPSKITLDFTKTQILVMDLEWLGVGRVRVGFVIDGVIYYVHTFNHANILDVVYMSTPNLPLRFEISNDGNGGVASLEAICSTVISEGGQQDTGVPRSYSTAGVAYTGTARKALMGIRLKSTHLDSNVSLVEAELFGSTNNDTFEWQVVLAPTVAGTFNYVGLTNSAVEVATSVGDANTISGGTILRAGYGSSAAAREIDLAFQSLGSAIDGTPQAIVLVHYAISGNQTIRGTLNWSESS